MEFIAKVFFYFILSVFGIAMTDLIMDLQRQTIQAYQKGPIKAGIFTRMLTEPQKKK